MCLTMAGDRHRPAHDGDKIRRDRVIPAIMLNKKHRQTVQFGIELLRKLPGSAAGADAIANSMVG